MMGTRSGDVDPAMIIYIMKREDLNDRETTSLLNKHSGLLGISGTSSDMREIIQQTRENDSRAKLALSMFTYRLKKYISAYSGIMGGVDSIVFTGGIGENAPLVRENSLTGLDFMGIRLDNEKNNITVGKEGFIEANSSKVKIGVIPTNEELVIALETEKILNE
jgi:acetate kinase